MVSVLNSLDLYIWMQFHYSIVPNYYCAKYYGVVDLVLKFINYNTMQVLLELGELFPAVESAEKAVSLDVTWAVARQMLGRAQLGLGEIEMVRLVQIQTMTVF